MLLEIGRCPQCGRHDSLDSFDVAGADDGNLFCTHCHCEATMETDEQEALCRLNYHSKMVKALELAAEFLATHPSGPAMPIATKINEALALAQGEVHA